MSLSKEVFLAKYGNDDHVKAALKADDKVVRMNAASNHTISKENIETALSDGRPSVRLMALRNPSCPQKHLTDAMKNGKGDDSDMRNVMINPNATKAHIDAAIKSGDYRVLSVAASHKNTTPEHIDKLIKHNDFTQTEVVERNPNLTKENLNHLIANGATTFIKKTAKSRLDKGEHI